MTCDRASNDPAGGGKPSAVFAQATLMDKIKTCEKKDSTTRHFQFLLGAAGDKYTGDHLLSKC